MEVMHKLLIPLKPEHTASFWCIFVAFKWTLNDCSNETLNILFTFYFWLINLWIYDVNNENMFWKLLETCYYTLFYKNQ